ncbi:MAG: bifunctional diguanylate cyclase/phosphodiesterase [Rhodocyclaceae bacterium]|jgi:diguanylate cyclase (GGDEF)-like protein|nr:bifunctional diguanylate cyclase/phosphodiesterase [Rhodocyclaceae bacterium]MBK6909111.1 bifunctional diguanylate cyclase/phosphodiesterase [Rhodocyclaceae bacterium]
MPQRLAEQVSDFASDRPASDDLLLRQTQKALIAPRVRNAIFALMIFGLISLSVAIKDSLTARALVSVLFLGFLCAALKMLSEGKVRKAVILAVGVLLAALASALWDGHGLRDSVALALTLPIILTGMAANRRAILLTTGITLAIVLVVGVAELAGWKPHRPIGVTGSAMIMYVTILSTLGIVMAIISREFRQMIEVMTRQIRQLRAMNQQDALTGLFNRSAIEEQLPAQLDVARSSGSQVALLHLNIDNFKAVNDSLGHELGDAYLRHVGKLIKPLTGAGVHAARLSGDEFVIIAESIQGSEDIAALANRLRDALAKPWTVSEVQVVTTCSMGVALFPGDGSDFPALMKNADIAMRHAKQAGGNTFKLFREEMNSEMLAHLHVISGLRAALVGREFYLQYQPQIEIATGRMVGAEALIRWRHPRLGLIPPGQFIPAAERSGLIIEIGEWVLQEACRQLRVWEDAGMRGVVLAVNLSPVQFRRDNIEQLVINTLELHGIDPRHIELEITESMLMGEKENFAQMLRRMGDLGLKFAIDDFGTGYSNLAYLRQFAVDRLKIDRSFVHNVARDDHNHALVKAITEIGKSLSLEIVAEGVEDAETLDALLALGCHIGQGWHWAKAMSPDELFAYWQANS